MLDDFYDAMKDAYIFSLNDLTYSLSTSVYLYLRDNPDWRLSYYGEDYDTEDDLFILYNVNKMY